MRSGLPAAGDEPPATAALRAGVRAALAREAGPAARLLGPGRLARWGGLDRLLAIHAACAGLPADAFAAAVLGALGVRWRIVAGSARAIPAGGGCLVAATHPTGALEGLIAAVLVGGRRADWRILANAALARIPELSDRVIPVARDGPGGPARAMRAARRHLAAGGCLVAFPAGTVAHGRPGRWRPVEAPWHPGVLRLAERAGARCVTLDVAAEPGALWRVAAAHSRRARAVLLPRVLLGQAGARVGVRIAPGAPRAELTSPRAARS